jgi:hypothetical protein
LEDIAVLTRDTTNDEIRWLAVEVIEGLLKKGGAGPTGFTRLHNDLEDAGIFDFLEET